MKKNISYIRVFEYSCGILLFVMLVCILMQVFFRNILNYGLSWTEEMARYTMIWLTYMGAIVSLKYGSHIAIRIVVQRLSSNWQKYTNLIANLLILFFLLILLRQGVKLIFSPAIAHQVTPALQAPTIFVYSSLPICTGIMIIILIGLIVKDVKEILTISK